jgi:ferric-dicitrate binding protein FerR (iron transport regulator)
MEQSLSQREFDTWREEDGKFKDEMRALLNSHQRLHLDAAGRMATLEANQEKCSQRSTAVSAGIASVISAFVSGVFVWLAKS